MRFCISRAVYCLLLIFRAKPLLGATRLLASDVCRFRHVLSGDFDSKILLSAGLARSPYRDICFAFTHKERVSDESLLARMI